MTVQGGVVQVSAGDRVVAATVVEVVAKIVEVYVQPRAAFVRLRVESSDEGDGEFDLKLTPEVALRLAAYLADQREADELTLTLSWLHGGAS